MHDNPAPEAPTNRLVLALADDWSEAVASAFGKLLTAFRAARADPTIADRRELHRAAYALAGVVEDWAGLGEGMPWHWPPGGSPSLWFEALAFVYLHRQFTKAGDSAPEEVTLGLLRAGVALGVYPPPERKQRGAG